MAYDGLITKAILDELNNSILNGKINKIYQPNKNEILLGIYAMGKNYALDIVISSDHYRMNLTTHAKPNPTNAYNFCMVLRKYLIGSTIRSITQDGLERIITISLEGYNELNDLVSRKIVIELMGKHSNIILLNEDSIIIDSLRHLEKLENSYRDIFPGKPYLSLAANKTNLCLLSYDAFYKMIKDSIKGTESYSNLLPVLFNGISRSFVKNLIEQLQIEDTDISEKNSAAIYRTITNLISNIHDASCKNITLENGRLDYTLELASKDSNLQINFFLDDFYYEKETDETFKNYRNNVLKLILNTLKKLNTKIQTINQKLKECSQMDQYRLYGELITANLYQIKENNQEFIILQNYYDQNRDIRIPLDISISPASNAKKYFKKYNKLKNTVSIVLKQKEETELDINYIESIIYELDGAKTISDIDHIYSEITENSLFQLKQKSEKQDKKLKKNLTKKEENIGIPLSYMLEEHTVYVGKNNKQNDYLTTKFARSNDLWFHTKEIHGSHVILKVEGKEVSPTLLTKCAQLAAYYSKAKLSENVPVDYTYIKYVKKPSGSKPGMVIYTNHKTLYVNPNNDITNLL